MRRFVHSARRYRKKIPRWTKPNFRPILSILPVQIHKFQNVIRQHLYPYISYSIHAYRVERNLAVFMEDKRNFVHFSDPFWTYSDVNASELDGIWRCSWLRGSQTDYMDHVLSTYTVIICWYGLEVWTNSDQKLPLILNTAEILHFPVDFIIFAADLHFVCCHFNTQPYWHGYSYTFSATHSGI